MSGIAPVQKNSGLPGGGLMNSPLLSIVKSIFSFGGSAAQGDTAQAAGDKAFAKIKPIVDANDDPMNPKNSGQLANDPADQPVDTTQDPSGPQMNDGSDSAMNRRMDAGQNSPHSLIHGALQDLDNPDLNIPADQRLGMVKTLLQAKHFHSQGLTPPDEGASSDYSSEMGGQDLA